MGSWHGTDGAALAKFFAELRALERRQRRVPVVVLQIGDSHTANDAFSSGMREALQARFGNGGRGLLPPGIPFRMYNPSQVSVSARGDWQAISSADASAQSPFGIAGLRQRAVAPGAEIVLEAAPGGFARAAVEILRQPGGGRLRAAFDGLAPLILQTGAAIREAAFLTLPQAREARRLTLSTLDAAPVELLGVNLQHDGPGIAYGNLGTIGATVEIIGRWDMATVASEMRALKPALLVIAFGTNEGFNRGTAFGEYEQVFAARMRSLAAAAPTASVLVLGPPDGALSRGAWAEGAACADGTGRPPHLDAVRDAQRRAAVREGWAFWDLSAAMGGACSIGRWVRESPPLAMPDHVHLRSAGYRRLAAELTRHLMAAYEAGTRPGRR